MPAGFDTTKPSARMKFHKPTLLPQAIGHHTPAVRTLFGLATSGAKRALGGGRRRRKRKASTGAHVRKTRRAGSRRTRSARPAHMVKGSAAAKRHMAKIRRKKKA